MFRSTSRRCSILLALGVAAGCSTDDVPVEGPQTAAAELEQLAPAIDEPTPPVAAPDATPDTADPDVPDETDPAQDDAEPTAYKPPFPDRVDLFAAPERKGNATKDQDDSVELVGFAKRDTTQALLSFNGEVSPMSEGAERNGVQVISIQPPKVVLQRGRQRWQASIEN